MKMLVALLAVLGLASSPVSAYVGVVFNEDFEDDGAVVDNSQPFEGGLPGRGAGDSGTWLPSAYAYEAGVWVDNVRDFGVVGDGANAVFSSGSTGSPVARVGNEGRYGARVNAGSQVLNRDGLAQFTDSTGTPVIATVGQTIKGSMLYYRSGGKPVFGLSTSLAGLQAAQAAGNSVYGAILPNDGTIARSWIENTSTALVYNVNMASAMMFGNGDGGDITEALSPTYDSGGAIVGTTYTKMDNFVTGNLSDWMPMAYAAPFFQATDNPYVTIAFEYTVGDAFFTSFTIDGIGNTLGAPVPVGDVDTIIANGIDGFFLSQAGARGANPVWVDNIVIEILPVPEPASLSLLALGGIGMLLRR